MADPPPIPTRPPDLLLAWRGPQAAARNRDGSIPPSILWFLLGIMLCFCSFWVLVGLAAALGTSLPGKVLLLPLSMALPLLLPLALVALRISDPLKPRRDRTVGPTSLLNRKPGLRECILAQFSRTVANTALVSTAPELRIWAINQTPPRLVSACCGDPDEQAQLIRLSDKPPLVPGFWVCGSDPLRDVPLPSLAVLPSGCGTLIGIAVGVAATAGFIALDIWISASFVIAAMVCFVASALAKPAEATHGEATLYRFSHDTTDPALDLSNPTRAWNWASVGWNPPCWVAVKAGATPPLVPIDQATLLFVYLPEIPSRARAAD